MDDKIYVAVEIVKTGVKLAANQIISVGCVVGTSKGELISKHRVNFETKWPVRSTDSKADDYGDFEPPIWNHMMNTNTDSLRIDPKKNKEGWQIVDQLFYELELKYDKKLILVSSFPIVTFANLDLRLELFTPRISCFVSEAGFCKPYINPYEAAGFNKGVEDMARAMCPNTFNVMDPQDAAELTYNMLCANPDITPEQLRFT